jgi:drug/metabolite transporter (DMT)-like permease
VRRPSAVDLMLLGTVLLWSLNVTVTKYLLEHTFQPLAYATIRYFAAASLFWGFTAAREHSFRVRMADWKLIVLAAALIYVNQLGFVYGIKNSTAATAALILGTSPVWIGLISTAIGYEKLQRSYWVAVVLSLVGVGFVAGGTGGFSAKFGGDALDVLTAVTWSGYSMAIAPLMRRYSPFRISALVLGLGWIPLAITGAHQTLHQGFHFSTLAWIGFGYAVIGPLFLTNLLWFTAIDRVGPSRASLFANLQPFFAVIFALVLLGEHLNRWEFVGGIAIFVGIAFERLRRRPQPVFEPVPE